jgi:GalNAc-alpha-(1->4)-GalNAc-alpha-(1->3)-diNAcBac-PP-undecaprenol alpha-1,4-N-acetyl-D-galactosaminyltransferase
MEAGKKIKICLVIPSLQAGGMERVMSELANYFVSRENTEIHLVLYGLTREIFYTLPHEVIIHQPDFRFNNSRRLYYSLKTLFFLRRTVKTIKPETILSFGEYWNTFVLLSLKGLRYPIYISDRCSPEKQFGTFHSLLRRIFYQGAKGIIAQTETAKQIYYKTFRHPNIEVIGNPLRQVTNPNNLQRQNIVLMVGRLIKTKNQDKLIELFLNIVFNDWKLYIVGYDHLKQNNLQRLKDMIEKANATNKVFLEGKQKEVDYYYNISKIFAFTSVSEGFPNVVGEALSAGVPVVSFDCVAGPSEMINDNNNGYLIPVNKYELFQEKLETLMKNEDLRLQLGENARKSVDKFSLSCIGDKFFQFILNYN